MLRAFVIFFSFISFRRIDRITAVIFGCHWFSWLFVFPSTQIKDTDTDQNLGAVRAARFFTPILSCMFGRAYLLSLSSHNTLSLWRQARLSICGI